MTTTTTHVMPTGFLDGLPSIGLDALVAHAGLLTRTDRKYVLTAGEFAHLAADLAPILREAAVLDIDGLRTFGYRSLYLDTPGLDGYLGAGRKIRRRFKVRTRDYLDTGTQWIEVKTRGARGSTVKERVPLTGGATPHDGLAADDARFVADRLRLHHVHHDATRMRPTLETRYERATLLLPASGHRPPTRATFDTALTWTDPRDGTTIRRPDLVIVETKGTSAPSPLDRSLWQHGHRPAAMSKYGAGLAALRPDLPAYTWQRVLDRHIGRLEIDTPTFQQRDLT